MKYFKLKELDNKGFSLHYLLPLIIIAIIASIGARVIFTSHAQTPTKIPKIILSYGPDPTQTVQIYAQTQPNSPVVVMVHGGGWKSDVNANMENISAEQLRNNGNVVFDVNYPSDSDTMPAFPNEIDSVVSATNYAIANASIYNGNATKLTLLGGSSGAQLVAMAALQLNSLNKGTVSQVITLSGPFDFPLLIANWAATDGPIGDLHINNEMDALGCSKPSTCQVSIEDKWSPDKQVTHDNCPANWLILNESNETMPVEQADVMTRALKAVNCNVTETITSGTKHSFAYFHPYDNGPIIGNFLTRK